MDAIKAFYHKHEVLSNLILVFIVGVFLCYFALFFVDVWTNHGQTTQVPNVRNMSFAEAIQTLKKSDLKYEIADSVYDTNKAPGTVKEMWPHPGTNVKPGRVIFLTINSFEPQKVTITMPLTGVSSRQAITYLESLNIRNIRIVYVPSNFPDLVEGAQYKGKNITSGMKIPVNANIVLEVGTMAQPEVPTFDYDSDTGVSSDTHDSALDIDDSSEEDVPDFGEEHTDNHDVFN